MPFVEEFMTRTPLTLDLSATVGDAIGLMHDEDVRHLPVVDEGQALVGLISDRDTRALAMSWDTRAARAAALEQNVTELMSTDLVSCTPTTSLEDAVHLLLDHKVGAIPVVDARDNRLVGILSYTDLLRTLI